MFISPWDGNIIFWKDSEASNHHPAGRNNGVENEESIRKPKIIRIGRFQLKIKVEQVMLIIEVAADCGTGCIIKVVDS